MKQSRTTFIHAIAAAAVVSFARWFALAFSPNDAGEALVNTTYVDDAIGNVLTFVKLVLATLLTVNIVIQGMRMVVARGNDEKYQRARKLLIAGFIGVTFIMLANRIAIAVNPQEGNITQLGSEIVGISNYIAAIVGFGAVVVIIVAGIFLVISVNESLKDRAKTMVKTAIVALIAVVVAYALVSTFVTI